MSAVQQMVATFKAASGGGGGSIAFRSAGTVSTGSTMTPGMPAGFAAGDLLVIVADIGGATGTTTPTGYTALNTGVTTGVCVFYKVAIGGETSPTISVTGASQASSASVQLAYSGANATTPIDVQMTARNGSASTSSITTTSANDFVVSCFINGNSTAITAPASTNARVSSTATVGLLVADEAQVSAGATTVRTATFGSSSNPSSFAFAIKQ